MTELEMESRIEVFGMRVSVIQLACMTHLSRTTVRRFLKQHGYYDGNGGAAEMYLVEHGLYDAEAVRTRLRKIKLEHPDYMKREEEPKFTFGKVEKREKKKKPEKKLSYTEKLKALGFEPWPSDYELERDGKR